MRYKIVRESEFANLEPGNSRVISRGLCRTAAIFAAWKAAWREATSLPNNCYADHVNGAWEVWMPGAGRITSYTYTKESSQ